MNSNILKRLLVAVLLAAVAFISVSCTEIPESTEEDLQTALVIGEYEVPFEEYYYFIMNYKYEYDNGDDSYWDSDDIDAEAIFNDMKKDTEDALLRCYATFSLAKKYGIDKDSDEISKIIDESVESYIKNDFGDKKNYIESLQSSFMNDSVFRFVLLRFECDDLLNDALVASGKIKTDDSTVLSAIMDGEEFCRAKQILIKNDPGEDPAENLKKAKEALNAASLGVDFDKLVAEYGEDTDMVLNPTGYYFTRNQLIEEFEEAAFALEIGEMSGIVESHLGYHIILRCEPDPDYVSVNYETLREAYLTYKYQAEVEAEMANYTVKETSVVSGLTLKDLKY